MTYPTVTNTVLTVSGLPLANAPVNISLSVGGFNTDDNNEMNSGVTVYTNASGVWSATLKPNALINPSGTYYTVSEPNGAKWTAIVPNGAGPYLLVNILTATPPNPTPGAPFVTSVVGQTGAVTGAQIVADSTVAGTFVHQTGNESIAGVKSFSSSPVVPNNAALDNSTKAANTAYVDTAVATQHTADTATYGPVAQAGLMAYAENISAQTTPGTGAGLGTAVQGCTIYVASSNGLSVDIDFGCQLGISTAGQGSGGLILSEWTGGVTPSLPTEFAIHHFDSAVAVTADGPTLRGRYHVGVVTTPRIFALSVQTYAEGSGLVVYARNGGAANATYAKTWMEAVAR